MGRKKASYEADANLAYAVAANMQNPRVFDFAAEGRRCIVKNNPFDYGCEEYDGLFLLGAGDVVFEPTRSEANALLMLRRIFSTVHIMWIESSDSWKVCCDFGKIVPASDCRFTALSEYSICAAACGCVDQLLVLRNARVEKAKE